MASKNRQEGKDSSKTSRTTMTAPTVNATATFKAGMLDLEQRLNAAGDGSCMTCFGGKQSAPAIGGPSQVQMEGKKILRALSAFSCISLKTLSSPNTSDRKSALEAEKVSQTAKSGEKQKDADQRILLRIVMWGGPNTLLLLVPSDAPAECVIEMVLDSYIHGVGLQECHDFELFCAHCNSPALHPKQPIGSVGSRHFLLCKKGPQISGGNFFNSNSQISQFSSLSQSSKHSHYSHSHSYSQSSHSLKHSRSLSQGNSSLFHSSSAPTSHHRRSNSWWNPVQCLTVGQH